MLKVTVAQKEARSRLVLEGRLAGLWVDEAREAWRKVRRSATPVIVDLTGVTFVDESGKALLRAMWRDGAELRAAGCCTRFIVEEITRHGRTPA
jgi:anti-anti-sigma regulatory factor